MNTDLAPDQKFALSSAPAVPEQFVAEAEVARLPAATVVANHWAVLAGVRFALALIVLCHHIPGYTTQVGLLQQLGRGNGTVAVMAFFIISGFSMAHSLTHNDSIFAFYERRFWRIYPCYLWALVLTVLPSILFVTILTNKTPLIVDSPDGHQFLMTTVFLQGFAMGFVPGNPVLWSLSVEVWLYLLAPALFRTTKRVLMTLTAISAVAFAAHDYVRHVEFFRETHGVDLACFAWAFIAGFAFYRFRDRFAGYGALLLAGVALACYYQAGSPEQYGPLTIAATITAIYYGDRWKMSARTAKRLSWLGDISLCLYLVHCPVMATLQLLAYRSQILFASSALTVAVVTYYLIDLPVRAYVRRRNAPRRASAAPSESAA